uniref:Uncharacterized protein n=1 Tax=Arundo donax TaxID=35708 RepID=A0A0A9HFF6_ARUDO
MPIYVFVAAERQPELWDAPLAKHLKDGSLVDDRSCAAVLGVVQPPRVAFCIVLTGLTGGSKSYQQLLRSSSTEQQCQK